MSFMTIQQALRLAQHSLFASDSAQIDAEALLMCALGKPRAHLYTWPEELLSPAVQSYFQSLLDRRILSEPIAYITGEREFWSMNLRVNPNVLIPRPETELLVEQALSLLDNSAARVADLGTGSGAIALALASERPAWQVVATDLSGAALAVAADNALRLGIANIVFRQGSWCEALPAEEYDLIVSNPPYIDPADSHLQQGDLRFEPVSALVAAGVGLADIRLISAQSVNRLCSGGCLLLEHGWTQAAAVAEILTENGFLHVETLRDLNDNERVTWGRKK